MSVLFTRRGAPPVLGNKASDYAVGESVLLNVSGTAREFIVVNQGNPDSGIYAASCNGTWLLMKDAYEIKRWDQYYNDYKNSEIHEYLNGAFLGLFESAVQKVIIQAKIPYKGGAGSYTTQGVLTGESGLLAKVFLLSGYEIGLTNSASDSALRSLPIGEGAKLSYFNSGIDAAAFAKRIAYYNGSLCTWWLRSPSTSTTDNVWHIRTEGGHYNANGKSNTLYCVRPAIILPFDTLFDPDTNTIL